MTILGLLTGLASLLVAVSTWVGVRQSKRNDDRAAAAREGDGDREDFKTLWEASSQWRTELQARVTDLEDEVTKLKFFRRVAIPYIRALRAVIESMGGHPPEAPDGLDID